MPLVAAAAARPYAAAMASGLLRLLALLALLLMPLAMAGTPAAAHQSPQATQPGHCSGEEQQQPQGDSEAAELHCTACAALPAPPGPAAAAAILPEAPLRLSSVRLVVGIEPETATPPPKRS